MVLEMAAEVLGETGGEEALEVVGEGDRPPSLVSPSSNEVLRFCSERESS